MKLDCIILSKCSSVLLRCLPYLFDYGQYTYYVGGTFIDQSRVKDKCPNQADTVRGFTDRRI